MQATARLAPPRTIPRLVLDAAASPHVRLRVWEADAGEVRASRPAAHGAVELTWLVDGAVAYDIGSRHFSISGGQAMLVPSDAEHATTFPSHMRGAAIWLDRDVVAEIADAVGCTHGPLAGHVPDGPRIAALGAVLAEECRLGGRGALLAVEAIAESMIAIALRKEASMVAEARGVRDPAIASAIRYVEAAYAEPISVESMARTARMSRFHFSRRFREATGRSPYRYLVDVRLERAAELLRRGRCGITEAALSVGFSDPSRFARSFRARFGASPARWAEASRARVLHVLPMSS